MNLSPLQRAALTQIHETDGDCTGIPGVTFSALLRRDLLLRTYGKRGRRARWILSGSGRMVLNGAVR